MLLQVIAIFLLICAAVAWGYGEEDLEAFLLSALITTRLKGIIDQLCRHAFLLERIFRPYIKEQQPDVDDEEDDEDEM